MHLLVPLEQQLDSGDGQDAAEDIHGEVKPLQEGTTYQDETRTHDQRPHHTPEEHAVLVHGGHGEGLEDDDEDEDVVRCQRLFQQVARGEFKGAIWAVPAIDGQVEDGRQADPHHAPQGGLAQPHGVGLAVKDTQIHGQQGKDETNKPGPSERRSYSFKWHGGGVLPRVVRVSPHQRGRGAGVAAGSAAQGGPWPSSDEPVPRCEDGSRTSATPVPWRQAG